MQEIKKMKVEMCKEEVIEKVQTNHQKKVESFKKIERKLGEYRRKKKVEICNELVEEKIEKMHRNEMKSEIGDEGESVEKKNSE